VSCWPSFTSDLEALVGHLKSRGVESVAMESTGVYWIHLYLLLEESGIEVCLVNARDVKNVSGRKTDEKDAVWIMRLHSYGLLRNSFQPEGPIRVLRNYVRHRKNLIRHRSNLLNRIQKSLEQMNIKIHTVISDIDGVSGMKILTAIIDGERDATTLATLCDGRIKTQKETIIKSLQGIWREEHVFELSQLYRMLVAADQMITECDQAIKETLLALEPPMQNNKFVEAKRANKQQQKNSISFDVERHLIQLTGVNPCLIEGLSSVSALSLIAETGLDMDKWKTPSHFCSWLNLVPNTKITGGKIISSRLQKKKNPAGQIFRAIAWTLSRSKHPLGEYYRKMRAKGGGKYAVVATAHKVAKIYYHILKNKVDYDPQILIDLQQKNKEKKISVLRMKLARLEAT
jgi:transposase